MQAVEQYQLQALRGASPAQLVAMLYEGIDGFVGEAAAALDGDDAAAAAERLRRAQDIVVYLRRTLNPRAGDLAVELGALYADIDLALDAAREAPERGRLDAVQALVLEVRRAWTTATMAA